VAAAAGSGGNHGENGGAESICNLAMAKTGENSWV